MAHACSRPRKPVYLIRPCRNPFVRLDTVVMVPRTAGAASHLGRCSVSVSLHPGRGACSRPSPYCGIPRVYLPVFCGDVRIRVRDTCGSRSTVTPSPRGRRGCGRRGRGLENQRDSRLPGDRLRPASPSGPAGPGRAGPGRELSVSGGHLPVSEATSGFRSLAACQCRSSL